jgi:hypothetical protein
MILSSIVYDFVVSLRHARAALKLYECLSRFNSENKKEFVQLGIHEFNYKLQILKNKYIKLYIYH